MHEGWVGCERVGHWSDGERVHGGVHWAAMRVIVWDVRVTMLVGGVAVVVGLGQPTGITCSHIRAKLILLVHDTYLILSLGADCSY